MGRGTNMSRPTVLMSGPLSEEVTTACEARFELIRLWEAPDYEALVAARGPEVLGIATGGHVGRVSAELMEGLPNLQIVSNIGVGYDTVDVVEAARRGVIVTNTPGVLDDEVADSALGLLLMTVRELSQAERYLRAGRWKGRPYRLTPNRLAGRRMGVLGLGRIGESIARRAQSFGVTVVYHNRREKDVPYRYCPNLLEMAQDIDILMVVAPGGAETRHLVDAEVLRALGPGGVLINIARGSVVDEPALIAALQSGVIRSAGLDVFEHEPEVPQALIDMEHVVLLPHVGSASVDTRRAMGQLMVDNLATWFDTGRPLTPVAETPEEGSPA